MAAVATWLACANLGAVHLPLNALLSGEPLRQVIADSCELVWAEAYGRECLLIQPGEGLYCCPPLFHVTCQGTVLAALVRAGYVTIDRGFDPIGFWTRIREAVMFTFVGTSAGDPARRRCRHVEVSVRGRRTGPGRRP